MKFSFRHVFNIGAVVVLLIVVVMAMGYNKQAAMMPLLIGVPVLILAVAQMVVDFRADKRREGVVKNENAPAPDRTGEDTSTRLSKEVNVSLWVIGMFVSIYLVGFLVTTFLYTLLSLKVRSGYNWKISLGIAGGSWAFLYLLMVQLMEVDLYDGVILIALQKAFID